MSIKRGIGKTLFNKYTGEIRTDVASIPDDSWLYVTSQSYPVFENGDYRGYYFPQEYFNNQRNNNG